MTNEEESDLRDLVAGKGRCSCHHAPCVHDHSGPAAAALAALDSTREALAKEEAAHAETRAQIGDVRASISAHKIRVATDERDAAIERAESAESSLRALADAARLVTLAQGALASARGTPTEAPPRGLDTPTMVRFYEHDFYPLSNFSSFSLMWKGHRFDTSEAAYHWEKFPGMPIADDIRTAPSAHQAFKLAEQYRTARRRDWDDVKVGIMRAILRAKIAQHEYVRRKLLATGDRLLVEDSWRDDFWGWGPNRDGQNMLGKLWMELRSQVRGTPTGEPG